MCGKERPVIVDGRNVVELDEFIEEGFAYKRIRRGDKMKCWEIEGVR